MPNKFARPTFRTKNASDDREHGSKFGRSTNYDKYLMRELYGVSLNSLHTRTDENLTDKMTSNKTV